MADINLPDDITTSLVLPIVKDLVMPKIELLVKRFPKKNIKLDQVTLEKNFETYLQQRYEKYLTLNTLVFTGKQTPLKLLYEPLTVSTSEKIRKTKIKIDGYPQDFLPHYGRVLIEDSAGMGKSTITKRLFLSIIEEKAGIPILIELRQLSSQNTIIRELQKQLSKIGDQISIEVIQQLINTGNFIFLFDGFDEIPNSEKESVINDLHYFVEKGNNNNFLITSRPSDSLASFGFCRKFNIEPLTPKEAYSLICKYDYFSYNPIADVLIPKLKANHQHSLRTFLQNPFLVSLLYKSFEFKKDIPLKKTQFYRQVYDALFESHDLSKEGYFKREKYSQLHLDDFERVLRYVGYLTSCLNEVEYERDKIIQIIQQSQQLMGNNSFKASDFLKDLLETVPLFLQDGIMVRWAHKSLQDFFAARFIWLDAETSQEKILQKLYKNEIITRFENVLDLFYELNPQLFEKTILLWFLEEFNSYCDSHYTNDYPLIDKGQIKLRKSLTFNKFIAFFKTADNVDQFFKVAHEHMPEEYSGYDDMLDSKRVMSYDYSDALTIFSSSEHRFYALIRVLSSHSSVLVMSCRERRNIGINYDSFDNQNKDIDKLINKKRDTLIIDDSPSNIVNSNDFFVLVNNILCRESFLDYDNCIKKLAELKRIQQEPSSNILLNWE